MAYRNKTYVAFDGDNDISYYNIMKAWRQNDNSIFNFYDAHDINNALDSSIEETIKEVVTVNYALPRDTLAIHIPFSSKLMQYALENWGCYL